MHVFTAIDMFNGQVLQPFEMRWRPLLRTRFDQGIGSCSNRKHDGFALYFNLEGTEKILTTAFSPQTNGICEQFLQMIHNVR